jgi:exosortase family protein XrtG
LWAGGLLPAGHTPEKGCDLIVKQRDGSRAPFFYKIAATIIVILIMVSVPVQAFAESITTDGEFGDWTGKPGMQDRQGDGLPSADIIQAKWFPDSSASKLYLYCERLDGMNGDKKNPRAVDWNFQVGFSGDCGKNIAFVSYHPESRQVEVKLVDAFNRYLWSAKGKWGDDKYTANKVEFYIPLEFLAGSPASGYQFDMSFLSIPDRMPDCGFIKISTASTFPWTTTVLLFFWILILIFLHRQGMHFFKFIAGSVGLFLILMNFGTGFADKQLEYAVTWCLWLIGRFTGMYGTFPDYSLVTVYRGLQAVSFIVDYECSGFIEMLVYICLLTFYPVYGPLKKLFYGVGGMLFIFAANIFRIFIICLIIKVFGTQMFFFSHTVFARIIFFMLTVLLYYYVFTRPHILKQKVGDLTYV